MKKLFLLAPLFFILLMLNGCQKAVAPSEEASAQEDEAMAEVLAEPLITIENSSFSPNPITIKANTTVTWVNRDELLHRIIIDDQFDSGNLNKDSSFTVHFDVPGTYSYYCMLHTGNNGQIIVE